jgi:hypothetical protein
MKTNTIFVLIAALFLMSVVACASQGSASGVQQLPDVSPQQVAQDFYDDYRALGSSLLSGDAYKNSPYLNADGVKHIEKEVAGFGDGPGADPFVCAQDMPNAFTAGEAEIDGSQAIVVVESDWGTRTQLTLTITDGEWKISKIDCLR